MPVLGVSSIPTHPTHTSMPSDTLGSFYQPGLYETRSAPQIGQPSSFDGTILNPSSMASLYANITALNAAAAAAAAPSGTGDARMYSRGTLTSSSLTASSTTHGVSRGSSSVDRDSAAGRYSSSFENIDISSLTSGGLTRNQDLTRQPSLRPSSSVSSTGQGVHESNAAFRFDTTAILEPHRVFADDRPVGLQFISQPSQQESQDQLQQPSRQPNQTAQGRSPTSPSHLSSSSSYNSTAIFLEDVNLDTSSSDENIQESR